MGWTNFTISAFDSPNMRSINVPENFVRINDYPGVHDSEQRRLLTYMLDRERRNDPMLDEDIVPYIFPRRMLPEFYKLWGVNNQPSWYSRVLGEFPQKA